MEYYVIVIKDTGKKLIKGKYATLKGAIDSARGLWRSLPAYNTFHWDLEVRGYQEGNNTDYTTYKWREE